jgi:adenosine deaminase
MPNLPLIDLHRHLNGSVRLETIPDLGHRQNLKLPAWDVEGPRPYIQIAAPAAGLSPDQIHQVQRNALEIAFLSPEERRVLLEKKIMRK